MNRRGFFATLLSPLLTSRFKIFPQLKKPYATNSLTHLSTVFYKRRSLDILKSNLVFSKTRDTIPAKKVQWFRYK